MSLIRKSRSSASLKRYTFSVWYFCSRVDSLRFLTFSVSFVSAVLSMAGFLEPLHIWTPGAFCGAVCGQGFFCVLVLLCRRRVLFFFDEGGCRRGRWLALLLVAGRLHRRGLTVSLSPGNLLSHVRYLRYQTCCPDSQLGHALRRSAAAGCSPSWYGPCLISLHSSAILLHCCW